MAGVNTILETGKKALLAHQTALQVTGNNVANANTEGYSRQEVEFVEEISVSNFGNFEGTGVRVARIRQIRDFLVEERLYKEQGQQERWILEDRSYKNIEGIFNEPSEYALQHQLSKFWNAWEDLSQEPSNDALRANLVGESQTLTQKFQSIRGDLRDSRDNAAAQAESLVTEINTKVKEIADINSKLGNTENNNLKDRQSKLISDLSKLISIRVIRDSDGVISINSNGNKLVQKGMHTEVKVVNVTNSEGEVLQIVIKGTNNPMNIAGGKLAALVNTYNTIFPGYSKRVDDLARGLIIEINKRHSQGYSLTPYTDLESSYSFDKGYLDMEKYSEEVNLASPIQEGSFNIRIFDTDGKQENYLIKVLDEDNRSVYDIIDEINLIEGVNVSVGSNNSLKFTTSSGKKFSLSEDTSGFLAGIGLNNYFSGTNAENIDVVEYLKTDYSKIAASSNGEPGNNENILSILKLRHEQVMNDNSITLAEHYQTTITKLGVETSRVMDFIEDQGAVVNQLMDERDSISGVAIDEEMANIIRFQRGYQASAKIIAVVDEMMDIIINQLKR